MYGPVFLLTAVQAGGKHEHVAVALETCLNHAREVATVAACLVDADAHGLETRQVEQQVVDEVAETTVIVASDDGAETHAILSSQRVVRHEGVKAAVVLVGQVLLTHNLNVHLKIAHTLAEPLCARQVAALPQEAVHLILMDDVL